MIVRAHLEADTWYGVAYLSKNGKHLGQAGQPYPRGGGVIIYVVTEFDKATEEFLAEAQLKNPDGAELAQLFNEPLKTFVNSYPIGTKEAEALAMRYGLKFDLTKNNYFLDPYSEGA
ncbi:hypothetical protein ACFRCW_22890 [Streptomyces sp. NPDC056653]|uniref:DUF7683 domain-containing protein n=1 Tax=Streptomyces sp. NPDC056653 TaxID=3345894 RepID=UPI0036888C3C